MPISFSHENPVEEIVVYDIKNLDKMKTLEVHAPEAMKALLPSIKAALADGAIRGRRS